MQCLSQRCAAAFPHLTVMHRITEFVDFGHLRCSEKYVKSKVTESLVALNFQQNLDLLN